MASWKKGVIADVTPLEGVAKVWCKKQLLDEEDAKVWTKNWLLNEKGVVAGVTSRKRI